MAVIGAAVAMTMIAASAHAQLAVSRSDKRVLFLIPQTNTVADTTYAQELAEEVRRRMRSEFRQKLAVVPSNDICTILQESAYPCTMVLGPADSDRLARAVRADAYIMGSMWRENAVPMIRLHMVDIGRSGLSGWFTVRGTPGDPPRQFARTIVDSLDNQVRAAEWSRECAERRDRGDFRDAKDRAERVFQMYPHHPTTALCAWVVSEAMQEPLDSQVVLLQRAVNGDSTIARTWERLGQALLRSGDTVPALEAFEQQTLLNVGDRGLRVGVIQGSRASGDYERARDLAQAWIERNPTDLEMIQLKTTACVEGGLWECALESLARQFELDSSLASDTAFHQQIIGAAQIVGDVDAELNWSARAIEAFPGSASLLRAHASALATAEMTDSVLVIYEVLLGLDPNDVRSAFAGARILLEGLTIDTVTPLDTARLLRGRGFLDRAVIASQDTTVLMNAALMYFRAGSELVRTQQLIPTAIELLQYSIDTDVLGQWTTQSNFFLGVGSMYRIFDLDPQVMETQSCELVEEEARIIAQGMNALTVAAEQLGQEPVAPYMQQFEQFQQRIPQLREAYGCQ
jgi:tetratricopeptide (TPR) repeat protein